MNVLGLDFTSRPRHAKPLVYLRCTFDAARLTVDEVQYWTHFSAFEQALLQPGPWILGIDAPFGQARRFLSTIGWPLHWSAYVAHAHSLGREGFRTALDAYRQGRAAGDREHRRATDVQHGALSPQKLYGTPVALMFFECAPRLLAAGVHVPPLHNGDPQRTVVETYPAALARHLIGRRSYKQESGTVDPLRHQARHALIQALDSPRFRDLYGFCVDAPTEFADDSKGDVLDALLCAIQAAWAWQHGGCGDDVVEGWIAAPR